jgi:hypothetical protein
MNCVGMKRLSTVGPCAVTNTPCRPLLAKGAPLGHIMISRLMFRIISQSVDKSVFSTPSMTSRSPVCGTQESAIYIWIFMFIKTYHTRPAIAFQSYNQKKRNKDPNPTLLATEPKTQSPQDTHAPALDHGNSRAAGLSLSLYSLAWRRGQMLKNKEQWQRLLENQQLE